jgi:hypothetical protein
VSDEVTIAALRARLEELEGLEWRAAVDAVALDVALLALEEEQELDAATPIAAAPPGAAARMIAATAAALRELGVAPGDASPTVDAISTRGRRAERHRAELRRWVRAARGRTSIDPAIDPARDQRPGRRRSREGRS